jgi:hypothetical protein
MHHRLIAPFGQICRCRSAVLQSGDLTEFQTGPILSPHWSELCMRGQFKVDKCTWDSFHMPRPLIVSSNDVVGEAI